MKGPPASVEWPAVGCGADGCTADVWFTSRHPDASVLPPLTVSCPVHGLVGVHTEPPPPEPPVRVSLVRRMLGGTA